MNSFTTFVLLSSLVMSKAFAACNITVHATQTEIAISDEDNLWNNSKSKMYFNAIDKAREILEDDRDLAQKVPSFVAVGSL